MHRAQDFKSSVKVVSIVEKSSIDIMVGSKPGHGNGFEVIFT